MEIGDSGAQNEKRKVVASAVVVFVWYTFNAVWSFIWIAHYHYKKWNIFREDINEREEKTLFL